MKPLVLWLLHRLLTAEAFPPRHSHIAVPRLLLQRVAEPPRAFGSDELRPRAAERLVDDVARSGVELDRSHEQLDGLLRGVDARLLALLVDVPDRALVGGWFELRRRPLDPPIETRLVRPEVVRAGKHAARFNPHDGLVHQEPAVDPRFLDQLL